ncbi:MAG: urease accessory protein UreD [Steroidobacteraceae bacterium]
MDSLLKAEVRHQRADGAVVVSITRDASGTSRLCDLYQRAALPRTVPDVAAGEPLQAVLLTTSGGLTGGDRTRVEFSVGTHARATLTTQAAEKLYRALPVPQRLNARSHWQQVRTPGPNGLHRNHIVQWRAIAAFF